MAELRDRPDGEDLPAAYVNPWGLLRRDLGAVLASMRLELWQLWRRNRQGDLPRPAFWPQSLAAGFWPLLLALLLSLLVAAAWGLGRSAPQAPAAEVSVAVERPVGELLAEPPSMEQPIAEQPPAEQPPAEQSPVEELPAEQPPEIAELPAPAPRHVGEGLQQGGGLLGAARLREPDGDLELVLDPTGWQALPTAERQVLAEQWQLRAESLGSGRLWLLDSQGTALARSARVGSGMILLAPPSPAHAP
ncbi:MAG: hypothetical protein ACK5GZ_12010 [Cyanobium sp.]